MARKPQFIRSLFVSHITEANALLLRYEGNMVFTVKVFGSDGFQRDSKHQQREQLKIFYCILNPLVIDLNELNTEVHVSVVLSSINFTT